MPVLVGFTMNATSGTPEVTSGNPSSSVQYHVPGWGGADGPKHPARIILTTITTVNKGMINFFIFASSVLGHR
jgi:hypothetical protein